MDQEKQLILLIVNSCNSCRVHFFPSLFSMLKIINKTLLITEHLVISKYQYACLHHTTEFNLTLALYLLELENCCLVKLYNSLL